MASISTETIIQQHTMKYYHMNNVLELRYSGSLTMVNPCKLRQKLPSITPEFPSAISLDTRTTLTSNLKERVENKEQLNCQFSWKDQFASVDVDKEY